MSCEVEKELIINFHLYFLIEIMDIQISIFYYGEFCLFPNNTEAVTIEIDRIRLSQYAEKQKLNFIVIITMC